MRKKIIDIVPPGKKPVEQRKIEKIPEKITEKIIESVKIKGIKPVGLKVVLIAVPLIIAGVFIYFNLGEAKIEIWPKINQQSLETKLIVAKSAKSLDFDKTTIPATLFEAEKNISGDFSSSGEKVIEKKAEGTIKIYNNYSSPQVLVANTRFQPPLEKFQPALIDQEKPFFRTKERVQIPAKGSLEVRVTADSPGEKYNINSSKFSIPGLAGTPQYTLIYGESSQEFKGGEIKKVPQVLAKDLQGAKDNLTEQIKKSNLEEFSNRAGQDLILLADTFKTDVLDYGSLVGQGVELAKFNYQVKAKSQALAVSKQDLEKFSQEFILNKIADGQKLDVSNIKTSYSVYNNNYQAGNATLSLNLEAKTYRAVDETGMKNSLFSKKLNEARLLLENQEEIDKIKISLWPFWLKSVPKDAQRIKIEIKLKEE